jgi:hypothetical protein
VRDDAQQAPSDPSEPRRSAFGPSMSDVLALPDDLRQLFTWMRRQGDVSRDDVVAHAGEDADVADSLLATLLARGFIQGVEGDEGIRYRPRLSVRPSRPAFRRIAMGD